MDWWSSTDAVFILPDNPYKMVAVAGMWSARYFVQMSPAALISAKIRDPLPSIPLSPCQWLLDLIDESLVPTRKWSPLW